MNSFDFNQRGLDNSEGRSFGGQNDRQSMVDMSNPNEVRGVFGTPARGDQSPISPSGQMIFSNAFEEHGGHHHQGCEGDTGQSRGNLAGQDTSGQASGSPEAQIQLQLQQIETQLQQLTGELTQLLGDGTTTTTITPQAGSDSSISTAPQAGSDGSTITTAPQSGSDGSTITTAPQSGSDGSTITTAPQSGSDGSTITTAPQSGSDGSVSSPNSGTSDNGQGSGSGSGGAGPVDATGANFSVVNGQIIGPDGQPFIGKGINVDGTLSNAEENTILQDFPGLNFIRLATGPSGAPFSGNGTTFDGSDSVSQIQQFIDTMTAHGIVVEVENHNSGHVPTGPDVTNEDNWISQIASQNTNNPLVWFGSANEPAETNGSAADIVTEQQDFYNAVRSTGNNNMIMLEPSYYTPSLTDAYTNNPDLQSYKNVAIDAHFYGANLDQVTSELNSFKGLDSADGQIPIMIGEYGPTTGPGGVPDASTGASEAEAVQQAVNNGLADGAAAWLIGKNQNSDTAAQAWTDTDELGIPSSSGNGSLTITPWGNEVASWIQTGTVGTDNP